MKEVYELGDQAIGSFMMILQKGLIEGVDVTNLFRELLFVIGEEDNKLYCTNPPKIELDFSKLADEDAAL